jgi:4-coumarate--CoA ligase
MTPGGYVKTGDIGYQNKEGNFWITDRLKEFIKYKGFQVAPAELEGLLVDHPKIDDACVLGFYDPSEIARAYVVKALSARGIDDVVLEKEIQRFVAS